MDDDGRGGEEKGRKEDEWRMKDSGMARVIENQGKARR